jgi:hypothetical protein
VDAEHVQTVFRPLKQLLKAWEEQQHPKPKVGDITTFVGKNRYNDKKWGF